MLASFRRQRHTIAFDAAHRKVHYPDDRRFRVWIDRRFVYAFLFAVAAILAAAWLQRIFAGLPYIPVDPKLGEGQISGPHGFPGWIRWTHFFNFLFLTMLVRSGLSILMDHPRLYWNDDCTPGSEWIRFTPLKVPADRRWTAKDDARYISPLAGLPGYKHTVGMERSWHFLNVYGFVLTGLVFVIGLCSTDQWLRLHHCIQGWSGIAEWGGLSLTKIIELAKPLPEAKTVVFYSYGEGLYGGVYYDTQPLYNALKPGCMLAYAMNGSRLTEEYGAPLRLRVEDQLGYKMMKWIERIEFIESEKTVGKGEGGRNEDDEYFDLLPNV